MSGGLRRGQPVTVYAGEADAYMLRFQRYATVSRVTADGVYVTLDATIPPNREFGPLRVTQLEKGWKDSNGRIEAAASAVAAP